MANISLKIAQPAPDFCLPDQNEKQVCLKDFRGQSVVLYFYPKDNTPGCTIEALDFTKLKSQFEQNNAVVIGVSKDNCKSHQKFITGKKLTIILLSDSDTKVQKQYGVWRPKKFMGKEFLGTVRSTFLIDPQGKITRIWNKVSSRGHAREVLAELEKLSQGKS
jgi:peroxiredoxin Q/BCP